MGYRLFDVACQTWFVTNQIPAEVVKVYMFRNGVFLRNRSAHCNPRVSHGCVVVSQELIPDRVSREIDDGSIIVRVECPGGLWEVYCQAVRAGPEYPVLLVDNGTIDFVHY